MEGLDGVFRALCYLYRFKYFVRGGRQLKVLLIGASGFIGARLSELLLAGGHEVRALSRKKHSSELSGYSQMEWMPLDLLDPASDLDSAIAGCSLVFNCAGELREETRMEALHVDATARMLAACKRQAVGSGSAVHWVQLSSVGAYGPSVPANAERVVTEESVLAPRGAYEITKTRADELLISSAEPGVLSFSILRPSNVFGAAMPNDSLRQWGRIIRRRCFFYVGATGAISTYVHVDDVADALMLCGFDSLAQGEVFNASNDCRQEELVSAVARYFGVGCPVLRLPEVFVRTIVRAGGYLKGFPLTQARIDSLVGRTSYDCKKLKSILGWRPRRVIHECISEVFEDGGVS